MSEQVCIPALLVRLVEEKLECMETSVLSIPLLPLAEAVAVVRAGYIGWISPADEEALRAELARSAANGDSVLPVRMSGYRSWREQQLRRVKLLWRLSNAGAGAYGM